MITSQHATMMYRVLLLMVIVFVSAETEVKPEECLLKGCIGEEYICVGKKCYCADGYVADYSQGRCVKCPGKGEPCFGQCCTDFNNDTLHCWRGTCQRCYDPTYGHWICRPSINEVLLASTTQIAMASAILLGMLATFVLIYKLCAVTTLRTFGMRPESRLSIGSLQMYVDERLRNAPPRYSRTAPRGSSIAPAAYVNSGFIHDNSVPPPPYTIDENKSEIPTSTIHI